MKENTGMQEILIGYLQSQMDDYKKWEAKYGAHDEMVRDKVHAMIACKEMVESIIGMPVNLGLNGVVTVGF